MIKKKSLNSAFTLIELLVVITIIGILAGIALPVFNSVQIRGAQTKVLAQAKQVGLALKLYAADYSGAYPVYNTAATTPAQVGQGTVGGTANASNRDFFPLFPVYCQSESIFANKYNYYNKKVPDNVIDASTALSPVNTLATGENSFAYVEGLNDTMNAGAPIVFDAPNTSFQYVSTPNVVGHVWNGNKAVVVHLDNSASLDTLAAAVSGAVTTWTDTQNDPGGTSTTAHNLLDPGADTAITGCQIALPN